MLAVALGARDQLLQLLFLGFECGEEELHFSVAGFAGDDHRRQHFSDSFQFTRIVCGCNRGGSNRFSSNGVSHGVFE